MRRIRVAGACLLAMVAFGAVASATAWAEPPEIGRCVEVEGVKEGKKTIYSGGYGTARCIKPKAGHNGKFEWLPGPGPHNKYFGVGEETVLETVGGQRVFCSASVFKGEYTGPKTEKVKLSFDICEDGAKRPCQTTPAKEGEIAEQGTLEGNLAYIDGAKKTAGWDLKPEGGSGALFTYYCGKLPETVHTVEGSVIGQVKSGFFSNLNHMSKWGLISYKQAKGKQLPEAFEGQPNDTLATTSTGLEMRSPEQTGMSTLEESIAGEGKDIEEEVNEEFVETKTK